jgi:predicted DCC family thiol-disulfide oxidoreductase YuxK
VNQRPLLAGPILIYDGECGFCTRAAQFLSQRFRQTSNATARSYQFLGEVGLAQFGLRIEDAKRCAWWVTPMGETLGAHRAMAAALATTTGPLHLVGVLIDNVTLRPLSRAVYLLVAKNRRHLSRLLIRH